MPTLIDGNIKDQLFVSIPNMWVSIPELGLNTQADANGNFNFGYGDQKIVEPQAQEVTLILNETLPIKGFGNYRKKLSLVPGKQHKLNVVQIPYIAKNNPFNNISTGLSSVVLGNGDLTLDLNHASIRYKNKSSVMMQFTIQDFIASGMRLTHKIPIFYLMAGQPQGVKIDGEQSLTLVPASIYGNTSYLPLEGDYVPLFGRKNNTNSMELVGVGRLINDQIVSKGRVSFSTLDYIGFGRVHPDMQSVLADYADNKISLEQLSARLN